MATYQLVQFRPDDAPLVAGWLSDPWYAGLILGAADASVEAADVLVWTYEATRAYILLADGWAVGYGEIWEDDAEGDLEISRVVLPAEHGASGGILIEALVNAAKTYFSYEDVWLKIARTDQAGIGHAGMAGFTEVPEASGESTIWMKKRL